MTPDLPREPSGGSVPDPTVQFAVAEADRIRVDAAPTVVSWAAGPAAPLSTRPQRAQPLPSQPLPLRSQPFDVPGAGSGPAPQRRSGGLVAAFVVAGLFLAGGGYAAARLTILKDTPVESASTLAGTAARGAKTPASSSATPSAVAIPIKSTHAPTPTASATTVDSGPAARAQLEALVAQDAAGPIVRGQWVAQLSSKSEGVVDTTLQATPFTLPDILAEHMGLRNDPGFGSIVRLIHLGDWGTIAPPASPMWITVADVNAGSMTEVASWCEAHFSQRDKALENVCLPRELSLKTG